MQPLYNHYSDAIGLVSVHLIWMTYGHQRIFGESALLKQQCIKVFQTVADDKKWMIKALEISPDQVYLLVEYDHHHSIAQVVKAFQGRSCRILRREFPELRRLPNLWRPSYIFDTTGKVSTAFVSDYSQTSS
jgi:putative transposase